MCRHFSKFIAASAFSVLIVFLTACGSSSSGMNSGTGATGSGSPAPGGYAAGVGGAGQSGSAQFLVAIQVPGGVPLAATINSTGMLTLATVTTNHHTEFNPMAINGAIDPTGSFFYEAVWPGIWAFTINRQNGNLTEMSTSPYADTVNFDSVAVDQLGKFVYGYAGSQVYAYSIQSGTGALSAVSGSPFAADASGQQFEVASDRIAISQDDKYLYIATSAGIDGFTIDRTTGALTKVSGSPFGASAGVAFAISTPASGFLYETTADQSAPISGYSIDSSTGALVSLPSSSGPSCGASNLSSPASGKFLFGASCGMFQIDSNSGALTLLSSDPLTPYDGWSDFDPASGFLWIVNSPQPCFDCDVGTTTFQVDANTGSLTMVPNSFFLMQNTQVGDIQAVAVTH
jgi:6-phosphogluconolactonase (cycloisomerase 2 family)